MEDIQIGHILEKIAAITSVCRIRIGTRTPVALPQRITDNLADMIASFHVPGKREVAVVTHFEHSCEITRNQWKQCKNKAPGHELLQSDSLYHSELSPF